MASIKNLKRDINFLTEEVVGTSFLHYHIQKGNEEKKKKIDQIINEVLQLREEVINQINNPGQISDKKKAKAHYNKLYTKMLEKINESFDSLSKISA